MPLPIDGTPDAEVQPSQAPRRRAYHKKTRTGCKTCKIRRVRCDEGKPSCHRCVSTGRTCDGYSDERTLSPASLPSTASRQSSPSTSLVAPPKLLMPRKNPGEIRSYKYFLEVTGPALAGLFNADFWCRELPKICVADPALWHAVVALSSAHEAFGFGDRDAEMKPQYTLCLQQYSAAIASLSESGSPRGSDRWRAVIASAIFTCMCVIQGLYRQALAIHATAGCGLIREIEAEENANRPRPVRRDQHDTLSSTPISLRPVMDLLFDFEGLAQAFKTGGFSDDRNAASLSRTDSYGYWRFYKSPDMTPESPHHLAAAFMARARRAAEALQNGLGLWWQENRADIHKLYGTDGAKEAYETLLGRQIAHVRCYKELQKTLRKFQKDFVWNDLANELCILELMQLTNSLYLFSDPERPDPIARRAEMPSIANRIVDLCEQVLTSNSPSTGKLAISPAPLTSGPLFLMVHSGFSLSSRQRAMELLRRPRLEGFWEPALSASLAEAMWQREKEALDIWRRAQGAPADGGEFGYVDVEMPLKFRVCSASMQFSEKKREAVVTLMTQIDEENGVPPVQKTIHW